MTTYIILGVAVLLVLYVISIYNALVKNKVLAEEGWSGIDVQLRRRADLIPNLVETVKGYASHEDKLFRDIAEARARSIGSGSVADKAAADNMLTQSLKSLFAVAENYPELKADANFRDLQTQLAALEEEIQLSRRYYNGSARNLNTMIETFPSNIIANMFQFRKVEFYEIEDAALRSAPKVSFNA
ncbi:MAG: LemA family protein [Pseudomonadota bacterium]